MTDWPAEYAAVAARVSTAAGTAAPLLAGFSACVDQLYRVGARTLESLAGVLGDAADPIRTGFAAELLDRLAHGRDGEIFVPASDLGESWISDCLGDPVAAQVGGTSAQACWTLALLGVPTVLALADRSARQLRVLHPGTGVCRPGGVAPVGQIAPAGGPTKPPHYILEFTAGTRWSGGELPRSGRVILRLAEDGLECDPDFAANSATLAARAGAGLISGLNGAPEDDLAARAWVREVVGGWRDAGLPTIHLELAEYARRGAPRDVVREYAPLINSLGLSLAELVEFEGSGDPPTAAVRVAAQFGLARVVVHADAWSLMVHRGDPATAATALKTGNLLAAARAANGRPTTDPAVPAGAVFVTTHPASRELGGGWRVECAPSPYLARPAATVGLGDTFVAGLLLAGCLSMSRTRAAAP